MRFNLNQKYRIKNCYNHELYVSYDCLFNYKKSIDKARGKSKDFDNASI